MRVEYGPPGHKGVTEIMGVGDDGLPAELGPGPSPRILPGAEGLYHASKWVGIGATATWAYAASQGDKKLKRTALGVAIASFVVHLFTATD